MEENDKIIAIAILSMLALIALIGFILYKIAIHRSIIPNINMAAPSSVPVKNNNFKLVDPNTIIEIKKNKGQEIFKGTDLGKLISVKKEYGTTNRIYQKETIDTKNGTIITIKRFTKQEKGHEERLFQELRKEDVIGNMNGVLTAIWKKPDGEGPNDMGLSTINYHATRSKQPKINDEIKQKLNEEEKFDLQMDNFSLNGIFTVRDSTCINSRSNSISLNLIEFSSSSENSSINSNSASTGSDEGFVEISVNDDLESLSNNEADYNFKKAELRLSSDENGDDASQADSLDKKAIEVFYNFKNKVENFANNALEAISKVTSNNNPNEKTPLLKEERQGPFPPYNPDDPLKGNEESKINKLKINKLKSVFDSALNIVSNELSNIKNPFRRGRSLSVHSYDVGSDSE